MAYKKKTIIMLCFLAKEMYEGTVRSLMEYGATVMEHLEHLEGSM